MNNILGERIKKERGDKKLGGMGISQAKLAERLGLEIESRQTIGAWESGKRKPPLEVLEKMCEIFNCDLDYLTGRYECKTRGTTDIFELTGLSEKSCKTLSTLKNNHYAYIFVDLLLQAPEELLEKLSKKLLGYACVNQVVSPAVSKYKDDLERLKIVTDIEVDGVTLPKVPVQDMETYALFDLWLSFSEFINAITNNAVQEEP